VQGSGSAGSLLAFLHKALGQVPSEAEWPSLPSPGGMLPALRGAMKRLAKPVRPALEAGRYAKERPSIRQQIGGTATSRCCRQV